MFSLSTKTCERFCSYHPHSLLLYSICIQSRSLAESAWNSNGGKVQGSARYQDRNLSVFPSFSLCFTPKCRLGGNSRGSEEGESRSKFHHLIVYSGRKGRKRDSGKDITIILIYVWDRQYCTSVDRKVRVLTLEREEGRDR